MKIQTSHHKPTQNSTTYRTAQQRYLGQFRLDNAGYIVTIDTIGTQTEIVQTIVEGGADYILLVKENQGNHFDDIQYLFEVDAAKGFAQVPHSNAYKVNKGHGRLETIECWVIDDEEYLAYLRKRERWPGLKSLVRINAQREMSEKVEIQISYFITSLPADAKAILKAKINFTGYWISPSVKMIVMFAKIMGLKIWQSCAHGAKFAQK